MSWSIWLAYVLAATTILIIPGPTIILVISQAAAHGRKSVVPLVAGVLCGDFTAMVLSLIGLGTVMTASAALFSLFKWVGALYLFYLGINLWRLPPCKRPAAYKPNALTSGSFFKRSFIVTAFNPKSIAFFVAFLPQFLTPAAPLLRQLIILGGTFLFLAVINATCYAVFASRLREAISRPIIQKLFNRCGGTALIGAGIVTAAMHRSS